MPLAHDFSKGDPHWGSGLNCRGVLEVIRAHVTQGLAVYLDHHVMAGIEAQVAPPIHGHGDHRKSEVILVLSKQAQPAGCRTFESCAHGADCSFKIPKTEAAVTPSIQAAV